MNTQEAFDRIYRFAAKQQMQSLDNGICSYNGPDGNHCYVGVLLDGINLPEEFNLVNVGGLINHPEIFCKRLQNVNIQFLIDCQSVHDNNDNWIEPDSRKARLKQLRSVAAKYNLSVPKE